MQLIKKLDMRFPTENSKKKYRYGLFLCPACTTSVEVRVVGGLKAKSCYPCSRKIGGIKRAKHNDSESLLHRRWRMLHQRCSNPNNKKFKDYGARGVKVCAEWSDYLTFKEWAVENGYDSRLSIDRIDNDGGYSPDNCRFTTATIQQRNSRLIRSNNKSGYRGVAIHKQTNKWRAYIGINGRQVPLGLFPTSLEAAKARDMYVVDNELEHTLNGVLSCE